MVSATGMAAVTQRSPLIPLDIAMLAYTAITTVAALLFARDDAPGLGWFLVANSLTVLVVFLAPRARAGGPVGRFVGDFYPLLLLAGTYSAVGLVTRPHGHPHDLAIQQLEQWLFGSQLSYRWIREMPNSVWSWYMHLSYLAYYPILSLPPLVLWLSGRRDAARTTMFGTLAALYACYVAFMFFPVAGPRYAFPLADNAATHVWPARATQWLLNWGDSWGAAFPSSHVAGAVVATVCAIRFSRALGLVLLPWTIGLVFGVVYGQFHYAVDVLAGLAVAAGVLVALRVESWRVRPLETQPYRDRPPAHPSPAETGSR